MIVAFLLLALLLSGLPASASAQPGANSAHGAKADRVLVVKSERRLYLLRDSKVWRSYRIALGRSGGLVMIHGQPSNGPNGYHDYLRWDWTEGCIAVSNAEMDEIWTATEEGTPIEILP